MNTTTQLRHIFNGPRWLTAPKGYKPTQVAKMVQLKYWLTWRAENSVVECQAKFSDYHFAYGEGESGQQAHDDLVRGLVALNRSLYFTAVE